MFLWDPNNLDSELEGDEARNNWNNSFWDMRLTCKAWLEGYVKAADEPEPAWPSHACYKKRLGIEMPDGDA